MKYTMLGLATTICLVSGGAAPLPWCIPLLGIGGYIAGMLASRAERWEKHLAAIRATTKE